MVNDLSIFGRYSLRVFRSPGRWSELEADFSMTKRGITGMIGMTSELLWVPHHGKLPVIKLLVIAGLRHIYSIRAKQKKIERHPSKTGNRTLDDTLHILTHDATLLPRQVLGLVVGGRLRSPAHMVLVMDQWMI